MKQGNLLLTKQGTYYFIHRYSDHIQEQILRWTGHVWRGGGQFI